MNTKSIQGKRIGRLILGWIGTVIGGLFTLAGILSAFACSEGCDGNLQSVFTGLTVFMVWDPCSTWYFASPEEKNACYRFR
jgi:hypothetical protein